VILIFNNYLLQSTSFAFDHAPARAWISIAGLTPLAAVQSLYASARIYNQ
jgi:hypothetical protein